MKKTLLLSLAAVSLMSVMDANAEYRRWDFTNWSSTTVSNLMAGAFANTNTTTPESGWSDVEKESGTAPTDISANKCFWQVSASGSVSDGSLTANGQIISETEGLIYTNTANRSLAIAVDYPSTSLGSYNGASYLWLGSSKKSYFTIPNVEAGTEIKIGIESHKPAEARGVYLYVGSTSGTKLNDPDGNEVAVPTTYEDQVFYVPTDLTDTPNEDGTYNIVIYNTNGCHLYYIQVGEDKGSEMDDINVAYLYDGTYNGAKDADKNPVGWLANGGLDADPVFATLSSYNVTPIDYSTVALTSSELNDSLLNFDLVVAGEAVSSGNALAKGLVDIVNKVPMLNLKSFMYKKGVWTWGAGSNPSTKENSIVVAEDYREDPLFADVTTMDENGTIQIFKTSAEEVPYGNMMQGYTVTEGSLIADDAVIATAAGINAIHTHGTKNEYMLLPISSDNMAANGDFNLTDDGMTILGNAVKILAATKSKVQNAAQPVISQAQADGSTTVSISCVTSGSTIYYTTDGTDPTAASTVYSEPFTTTQDSLVVKAFATAHGFNDSSIATAIISVQSQTSAPVVTAEGSEGYTTVTITGEEGVNLYYNFQGLTAAATSQLYTEPIVITEPATITAFAGGGTKLQSEAVSLDITVGGIPAVKDTVAHFNAGTDDWYTNVIITKNDTTYTATEAVAAGVSSGSSSAFYYFGKSAWSYYSSEVDHTEIVYEEDGVTPMKGVDGNDSIKTVYKEDPTALRTITSTSDTQWTIQSSGQVVTGETALAPEAGVGNGATGRYAESALDAIGLPTKGVVDFGGKKSGEPYTMKIVSNVKFTAPFDIVTYLGNGSTGSPVIVAQISTDGENWQTVDTLQFSTTQRYWKKTRMHVAEAGDYLIRLSQESGSSKAQLYDIIVVTTEGETGIETINEDREMKGTIKSFDLFGRQLSAPVRGQMYIQSGKKMIQR